MSESNVATVGGAALNIPRVFTDNPASDPSRAVTPLTGPEPPPGDRAQSFPRRRNWRRWRRLSDSSGNETEPGRDDDPPPLGSRPRPRQRISFGADGGPHRQFLAEPDSARSPEHAVSILLALKADPSAVEKHGKTPIILAIQTGSVKAVRDLLAGPGGGAAVAVIDRAGRTAFHHAVSSGSAEMMKLLLDLPLTQRPDLDAQDENGRTALHHATAWGSEEIMKLLGMAGARVDVIDHDDMTPLHYAALRRPGVRLRASSWERDEGVLLRSRPTVPSRPGRTGRSPKSLDDRLRGGFSRPVRPRIDPSRAPPPLDLIVSDGYLSPPLPTPVAQETLRQRMNTYPSNRMDELPPVRGRKGQPMPSERGYESGPQRDAFPHEIHGRTGRSAAKKPEPPEPPSRGTAGPQIPTIPSERLPGRAFIPKGRSDDSHTPPATKEPGKRGPFTKQDFTTAPFSEDDDSYDYDSDDEYMHSRRGPRRPIYAQLRPPPQGAGPHYRSPFAHYHGPFEPHPVAATSSYYPQPGRATGSHFPPVAGHPNHHFPPPPPPPAAIRPSSFPPPPPPPPAAIRPSSFPPPIGATGPNYFPADPGAPGFYIPQPAGAAGTYRPPPSEPGDVRGPASVWNMNTTGRMAAPDEETTAPCQFRVKVALHELGPYLRDEVDSEHPENVLAVTGGDQNAYVAPASEYVEWRWRAFGLAILTWVLEELLDTEKDPAPSKTVTGVTGEEVLMVASGAGKICDSVHITGQNADGLVVCEVLAWIIAAFRKPHGLLGPGHGEPVLSVSAAEITYRQGAAPWVMAADDPDQCRNVDIQLRGLRPCRTVGLTGRSLPPGSDAGLVDGGATCWHNMFRAFVSVAGPNQVVPSRPATMNGIELPLELMKKLAGIKYVVPFLGTFVLKGMKASIIPHYSAIDSAGVTCIQWHVVEAKAGSGEDEGNADLALTMSDVLAHVTSHGPILNLRKHPQQGVTSVLDENARAYFLDTIASPKNRHFLGLYSAAEIRVGCEGSGAQFAQDPLPEHINSLPTKIVWGGGFSAGLDIGIPGGATVSASTSWALTQTQALHSPGSPNLWLLATNHCRRSAVMYDTTRRTAWMVPETCVILHLVQAWLHRYHPDRATGFPSASSMTKPTSQFTLDVCAFLESDKNRADLFRLFADVFQQMRERIHVGRAGTPLSFHSFSTDVALSGVPFASACELADPARTCAMRQVYINRSKSGGWPRMVTDLGKRKNGANSGYEMLVFFGSFHEPPIQPAPVLPGEPYESSCSTWWPVPQGREYLVAPLQCMKQLDTADANHFWVPSVADPFVCHRQACNRLQKLVAMRPNTTRGLSGKYTNAAALVFGGEFEHGGRLCVSSTGTCDLMAGAAAVTPGEAAPEEEAPPAVAAEAAAASAPVARAEPVVIPEPASPPPQARTIPSFAPPTVTSLPNTTRPVAASSAVTPQPVTPLEVNPQEVSPSTKAMKTTSPSTVAPRPIPGEAGQDSNRGTPPSTGGCSIEATVTSPKSRTPLTEEGEATQQDREEKASGTTPNTSTHKPGQSDPPGGRNMNGLSNGRVNDSKGVDSDEKAQSVTEDTVQINDGDGETLVTTFSLVGLFHGLRDTKNKENGIGRQRRFLLIGRREGKRRQDR